MSIDELKEKLEGVYDFDKPEDCQKVITMLLRDLDGANKRAGNASTQLKMLAFMVTRDIERARRKADDVLACSPRLSESELFDAMARLCCENESAGKLTNEDLVAEVLQHVWGDLDFIGRPSAVLEELLERFRNLTGMKE